MNAGSLAILLIMVPELSLSGLIGYRRVERYIRTPGYWEDHGS